MMELFFFQEEDGVRDAQESRGLGDVDRRQHVVFNSIKKLVSVGAIRN